MPTPIDDPLVVELLLGRSWGGATSAVAMELLISKSHMDLSASAVLVSFYRFQSIHFGFYRLRA
ncbi:MAG: hypothetical protein ACON4H_11870 [Rubripirellula sp.]